MRSAAVSDTPWKKPEIPALLPDVFPSLRRVPRPVRLLGSAAGVLEKGN
jgi:hypothetical protein